VQSTCAHLCVGKKRSRCIVRCYGTVAAGIIPYHHCQYHHVGQSHPPYTGIVSNVSIQVSQNDRGFVCFNPSQGITDFVHELRVQCTLVWTVYVNKTK